MKLNKVFMLLLAVLLMASVQAQPAGDVETYLKEIDPWVTTDTAKIMAYIDSANAVTTNALKSSKYWDDVEKSLSFLLGIDYVGSPQIDNTGRIYFQMRITGEGTSLFYANEPGGWPHQLTPNNWAEEGYEARYFTVHPSGDYLIALVDKFGDEMFDLYLFDRDGKFRTLLEDRNVRYVGPIFDEDNPDVFYMYTDDLKKVHFARYTISTGKLDTLFTRDGAIYPIDYHKGKLLYVEWLSFSESRLFMLDVATGDDKELTDVALFESNAFTAEGKVFTRTTAKSGEDEFYKFCLIDPAAPKDMKVIYDPKKESDGALFNKKTGVAIACLNNDGYSQLVAFGLDGKEVALPSLPIGVIGGQGSDEVYANDNGEVVYSFSSPTSPPNAYYFKLGDTRTMPVGSVATFGFDFSDIDVEVIRYPSKDGWEIPALLYKPKGAKKDGSNPVIVEYHGGPPSQSRPYFQRNLAYALSKGFMFMLPNIRGSSGYGPAYERADNLEKRFDANADCINALNYLIDQKWSSPGKIAVWGASYGGYIVNWLLTHASDKVACGISQVGVSDWDHTNMNTSQVFAKGWQREAGELGSELTRSLSPLYFAKDVSKPMLVTAGYNDPRVPPSDPRRFAYVLSRMGKPVWYYEETQAGHGGSFKRQIIFDYTCRYVFTMMNVMK